MSNTKKESYKKFLELRRREDEIYEIQKNLGYVELEKPIHHGYLAFFVLREDIARRENANELADLLARFSNVVWSRTKDFIEKRKKRSYPIEPALIKIEERDYLKLPIKTQEHFRATWVKYYGGYRKCYVLDFPSYYMVIKKKKDYITHRKVIDSVLEVESSFIHDKIWEITYKSSPWSESSMKPFSKIKNKSDRRSNKTKLKSNLMGYQDWEDGDFDLEKGLTYQHKSSAKWERW